MKTNNFLFRGASGRLGNFIVRQVAGHTIISLRPMVPIKKPETIPALIRASKYAKQVLYDIEMRNLYCLGINQKNTSAYRVAQQDFLNPPCIDEVDLTKYHGHAGDRIIIKACDDFQIKEVNLKLESGGCFGHETGLALPDTLNPGIFTYTCKCENRNLLTSNFVIEAHDYAGNVTTCCGSIIP